MDSAAASSSVQGQPDLAEVSALTWTLYKACKDSNEDFKRVAAELSALYMVLKETEDNTKEFSDLEPSRRYRLEMLLTETDETVRGLRKLLGQYESLRTQSQRSWDRARFGLEGLAAIRSKLKENTTMLTVFNSTLSDSMTSRLDKRLNKFLTEVRAGYREGSVVETPDVVEIIESPDVWMQLRRELEDVGVSAAMMQEHHDYISGWLKSALTRGLINEASLEDTEGWSEAPPRYSFEGEDNQIHDVEVKQMNMADKAFEAEMRERHSDLPPGELFRTVTVETLNPKVRKRSDPGRMLRKLFQKETALVQAASDGDEEKVARLISLGCNVNARDRWGWTALSMCGYGGFLSIAKMLLDHGADLDNMDVDGDTPMQLAITRGHADVVILFEQVREERDRLERELDAEEPRRPDDA